MASDSLVICYLSNYIGICHLQSKILEVILLFSYYFLKKFKFVPIFLDKIVEFCVFLMYSSFSRLWLEIGSCGPI